MTKYWARILMGLIFVFATISAPLHAQAAPAAASMVTLAPQGAMSKACAQAMRTHAVHGKSGTHGCCADGCSCPLSHCPATPALLTVSIPDLPYDGSPILTGRENQPLKSFAADTLIRPPRV